MFTFIDLFAGCGGMTLGFTRADFKVLGGIEKDEKAAATHARNFFPVHEKESNPHSLPRDITKLEPEQFMNEVLGLEEAVGLVDVIIGGPPCQAFARVGRAKLREIMDHPEAFLQDERANLYTRYLTYVEYFRPLAVVMENVPDIMNFGGTNVAEEIAASLESLGYEVRYTILNSAHYGVAQMRQRFFLIGLRQDLGIIPTFPACTHFIDLPQGYDNAHKVALSALLPGMFEDSRYVPPPEPSEELPDAVSAEEALADLPPIDIDEVTRGVRRFNTKAFYREDIEPSVYARDLREWPGFKGNEYVLDHVTRYLPRDYKIFERMKPGDQYPEAHSLAKKMFREEIERLASEENTVIEEGSPEWKALRDDYVPPYDPGKFPNKWRKMEPDQPSRTLTAHIGKDTYSHIHYDSAQSRVISVREAARLQSFPDGFIFEGAMNAAFRQIGNAVPPLQAWHIARQVRSLLEEHQPPAGWRKQDKGATGSAPA